MNLFRKLVMVVTLCVSFLGYSQQDPHFTQYMYNTMTVNPAYAGSTDHTVVTLLGRTQWVGLEGAPDTQTLSVDTPLNWKGLGLGVNLMNDVIGPVSETYADINLTKSIRLGATSKLAFGLKGGARYMTLNRAMIDSNTANEGPANIAPFNQKLRPTVGAGLYFHAPKYYLGLAAPNLIATKHYNENINSVSQEDFHMFAIAGYVFDINDNLKFKPAAMTKIVKGSPLSLDLSANFLLMNKFNAGLAWRWDDAVSALLGFKVNERFNIGYAFDKTTSPYKIANDGTHEIMLQYIFKRPEIVISPRFF